QDVLLPDMFRVFYLKPKSGKMVEITNDQTLMGMFGLFEGKKEVKLILKSSDSVPPAFKLALGSRKRRLQEQEAREREYEEQLKRAREEELIRQEEEMIRETEEEEQKLIQEELDEQMKFTVAIEVPVVCIDGNAVEYDRVYSSQDADEMFPGMSQPTPTQSQPTQNEPPTTDEPIENHPNEATEETEQTEPTQNEPPTTDEPIENHPTEETEQTEPTKNVPETNPVKNPIQTTKTTAKRRGTFTAKQNVGKSRVSKRRTVQKAAPEPEDDDPGFSDDSVEDSDYEGSTEEESDNISDISLDEEGDVEDSDDGFSKKEFEDYLDGSAEMDYLYTNGKVVGSMEFGKVELEPWMIFSTKDHFDGVFRDFCIQEGFAIRVMKADTCRYTACCLVEDCDWRIHASQLMDGVSWAIKTLTGEHRCGRLWENPMVSCVWLTRHLWADISANTEIPIDSLQQLCLDNFMINVKPRLLYKVKSAVKEGLHGGFGDSYGLLPAYAEQVQATNPGSFALVTWTGNVRPVFKACFFSFAAVVKGFLAGCRPLIGFDGTHLSGYYKGVLLTAVGIDGNNEILPLAYGIVASESSDSWSYFFRNLRILFVKHGCHRDDWTFMSDRMRGVEGALMEVFPRATRRICAQHLVKNCKDAGFTGSAFHKAFWTAADAYNMYVFNKAIEAITKLNADAAAYLLDVTEQWSRVHFQHGVVCDHNTNNFTESFNSVTKNHRDMPVFPSLEAIRTWLMKKVGSRFDKVVDMDPAQLTDHARTILENRSAESRLCYLVKAGGGEYEVRERHVTFPIRLATGVCGCGKWKGSGIPCKHALRVIYDQKLEPTDFVSHFFKGEAYKLTYSEHIHPMPDPSQWPVYDFPKILPPPFQRTAGRPQKQRKRSRHEKKKGKRNSTVKCGKCKEVGHNSRTCKGGATKKKRTRSDPSIAEEGPSQAPSTSGTQANNTTAQQSQPVGPTANPTAAKKRKTGASTSTATAAKKKAKKT
ncbi:Protein FAR1-RELATED SEQUENCE 8, partial [Bienertia sinuspersici]